MLMVSIATCEERPSDPMSWMGMFTCARRSTRVSDTAGMLAQRNKDVQFISARWLSFRGRLAGRSVLEKRQKVRHFATIDYLPEFNEIRVIFPRSRPYLSTSIMEWKVTLKDILEMRGTICGYEKKTCLIFIFVLIWPVDIC